MMMIEIEIYTDSSDLRLDQPEHLHVLQVCVLARQDGGWIEPPVEERHLKLRRFVPGAPLEIDREATEASIAISTPGVLITWVTDGDLQEPDDIEEPPHMGDYQLIKRCTATACTA